MPGYAALVQPPNSPLLAAGASAAAIRAATDANNLLKMDWAVVQGFRCRIGDNIRDALDLEFYSALKHRTYEYINVLPRQYIEHLELRHCPLDNMAIKELKDKYYRGWERSSNEQLLLYTTRLDQE